MSQFGTLIPVVALVLFALAVFWFFSRPKRPPTAGFKCARCGKAVRFSVRTEEAWRKGVKRLFCDSCHQMWLKSQPPKSATVGNASARPVATGRGCLSVTVAMLIVPIALLVAISCA